MIRGYTYGSAKGNQPAAELPSEVTLVTYPWAATEETAANKVARIAKQRIVGKSVKDWGS